MRAPDTRSTADHGSGAAVPPRRPRDGAGPRVALRDRRIATLIGIRRRPVAFVGLAVLAAGAVVVAVASPLLLRAAQQSSLAAATPTSLLAAVQSYGSNVSAADDLGRGVLAPDSLWRTAAPVQTSAEALPWVRLVGSQDRGRAVSGHLVWSPGCAGVRLESGTCPEDVGQVAVSTASGLPLGAEVRLTSTGLSPLKVVGRYAPRDGSPYSDPVMAAAARGVDQARANDLVVFTAEVSEASSGAWLTVVGTGPRHPLRLEDLPAVARSLAGARADLARVADGVIAAPIEQVLAAQRVTAAAAALVALAVAAQTLAVAWAAQALLVGGIARARAGEWGIVRLRGFRLGRRLVAVYAEPVLAVLIGSVAGYLLAAAVAQALASATTAAAVQPLQPLPLVVGALAALGSLVALVLASIRSATLPLAQLLRERAEPRRIGRLALVAQSGAVLATALVVYSVVSGGRVSGPQLPLLAPALVAVTIGVVALRIAVPLLRRRLGPTPRTLTGLLVGRRVIRTPSLLAVAVVLCVAVALSTAATQTLLTSDRLQHERAEAVVGAARVLEVRAPAGADLVAAVRRADPTGRLAMAAVDLDSGAGPQRLVAVDTARLGAVSSWHASWGGMSAARLHRLLAPVEDSSLRLTGRRLQVDLASTAAIPDAGGLLNATRSQLELSMTVQSSSGFERLVLGRLSSSRFTAALPCASGCRIVGFAVANRGDGSGGWSVRTDIAGLTTDVESAAETAALLRPQSWRPQIEAGTTSLDEPPVVRLGAGSPGLAVTFTTSESRGVPAIAPRDAPQPVPVLIGPRTTLRPVEGIPGSAQGSGLAFETVLVHAVGRAEVLPRAVGDGVLADLGVVQRISDPAGSFGRSQVWLSDAAGPGVVAALQQEGLRVVGQERRSRVEAGFLGETVPRVALQGAVIGGTGLVLALLALLVSQLLRRSATAATAEALRAAGAGPRTIRRIAFTETAAPAVVGAVLGAVAGVAGALLVQPVLPLGAGAGVLPPLAVAVSPVAALVPAGAAVVLILLIAAVTSTGGRR